MCCQLLAGATGAPLTCHPSGQADSAAAGAGPSGQADSAAGAQNKTEAPEKTCLEEDQDSGMSEVPGGDSDARSWY